MLHGENLARLGLQASIQTADCAKLASWWDGRHFDAVLAGLAKHEGEVRRVDLEHLVPRQPAQAHAEGALRQLQLGNAVVEIQDGQAGGGVHADHRAHDRAECLAAILHTRKGIVISGTHGKTTTSSMTAHVLRAPEDDVQTLAIDALVSASRAEGLAARIETLARSSAFAPGAEPLVRLVGPGPAYSFVRLTLDTAQRAA